MTDFAVKRSYGGRVWVMPPGAEPLKGEWKNARNGKRYFTPYQKEAEQYERASKAGQYLKGDGGGIANWRGCMAAVGTVMSESVRSQIATLINQYNGDPYYAGDDGGSQSGKSRLLEAVDTACKLAGSETASTRGTEFHSLAELINSGETPTIVQDYLVEPLAHYREAVKKVSFHAQEIVIVNDDLKTAGSIDYLLELPAGVKLPTGEVTDAPMVVAADLKTGKHDVNYPIGVTAQLAAYGTGQRYDQETNTRTPLHDDISTEWAVMVHYPLATKGSEVGFYWLSLRDGYRAAQLNQSIDKAMKYFKSVDGKPVHFNLP